MSFEDLPDDLSVVNATCPADFTVDGFVGTGDLLEILAEYGCIGDCGYDINGDGKVDTNDMLTFFAAYGQECQ